MAACFNGHYYYSKIKQKINLEKAIKIAIIHDLGEIGKGDVPFHIHAFEKDVKKEKDKTELATMEEMKKKYGEFGGILFDYWKDYENQESLEAHFVKALDKLDARITLIDDLETGNFNPERKEKAKKLSVLVDEQCKFDPILEEISNLSRVERQKKWGF